MDYTDYPCSAGYYCTQGHAIPCSPGRFVCHTCFVEIKTTKIPGTYNPVAGSSEAKACIDCVAGSYCNESALVTPTGPCSAGFYCLEKSATDKVGILL